MPAALQRIGLLDAAGRTTPTDGDYFPVENPATGEIWAEALEARAEHVNQVVAAAQEAYVSHWRDLAPDVRGQLLRQWADLVTEHREELADLEVDDVGHLRREALADVDRGAAWLSYYAGMADKIEGRTLAQYPDRLAYQVRDPYGVVAGINPFNGNPVMFGWKAGPALVTGNCLVLKAPELAPVSSFRMAELALEAGIPAGVVNVVTGRGEVTGKLLNEHPGIGVTVFTGSPGAAREVIRQSACTITPLSLELGGKNAVIVLEDADLETAIPSILHSNFVKSGQSCAAGSRVFVPARLYDTVCKMLAEAARRLRVGDPRDPASDMGAMISRAQRDRVERLVAEGIVQGAQCLAGGHPVEDGALAHGHFYAPTVLADLGDENVVARTELFGPVVSVFAYQDIEEVLQRANALRLGLTAQIWGNHAAHIQYLARHLEVGTVWVNTYRAIHPTLPYGGVKESGYGRENGFDALGLYTRSKVVAWDLAKPTVLPYEHS